MGLEGQQYDLGLLSMSYKALHDVPRSKREKSGSNVSNFGAIQKKKGMALILHRIKKQNGSNK